MGNYVPEDQFTAVWKSEGISENRMIQKRLYDGFGIKIRA